MLKEKFQPTVPNIDNNIRLICSSEPMFSTDFHHHYRHQDVIYHSQADSQGSDRRLKDEFMQETEL